MGHTEFLLGNDASRPSSLPEVINALGDLSVDFTAFWQSGNLQSAGNVSNRAMELFDFVSNELLREQVERRTLETYDGSAFNLAMNIVSARGVSGVTLDQQRVVLGTGPGTGALPAGLNVVNIGLDRLLNKIKHRNPRLVNFRIQNDRHLFVICPERTQGGPEGIYEFDVGTFCVNCMQAARSL